MRILIFIDHMESGGAARVTSIMCNGLAARGYHVVLAYNCLRNALYKCDKTVKVVDNHVSRNGKSHLAGIMLLIRRVIRYRKIIQEVKPDVVVGVEPEPYLYARLATICSRRLVVAVDHTSFSYRQHWFTRWIRWKAYRWADRVSILSHVDESILGENIPQKVVIHNPISFPIINKEFKRENIVLCVGRLDAWYIKGFDRMLRIWSTIEKEHSDWQLVFAGNGKQEARYKLIEIAKELHIENRIQFIGEVKDMVPVYRKSAVFALPSRVEGFPMCLLEAGSQGCACISFALGGITSEIFTAPTSGIIVEDNQENTFAKLLSNLLNDEIYRRDCSISIRHEMEQFSQQNFIDNWEKLLESIKK